MTYQRANDAAQPANDAAWAPFEEAAANLTYGNESLLDRWRQAMPLLDPAAWQDVEVPEREWALDGWIPARQATYLTGAGSAGKSLLAQQLSTCIALGLPFMGVEARQAVALYVTCEDDDLELHRRQKAICEALGIHLSDLSGKLHLVSLVGRTDVELAMFGHAVEKDEFDNLSPSMRTTCQWDALKGTAKTIGAGFVALDNVAHLFAGNENIRNEVASFVSLMNRLAIEVDGSVLFIGHPNKAGDSFSGSTAWENQVRSRLFMETPKGADGAALDPDARVLSRQKANYARNGDSLSFRWHHMAFVRDGDLTEDKRAKIAANVQASTDNQIFLACLAERIRQKRPVSEAPSPNYAPSQFAKMPESKGIGKARLEAAMNRLFRINRIGRAFVCRDEHKRRDLHGLVDMEKVPQTPAANAPQTDASNRPKLPVQTAPNIHPIPKGISGAAFGAAAPNEDVTWYDAGGHE